MAVSLAKPDLPAKPPVASTATPLDVYLSVLGRSK